MPIHRIRPLSSGTALAAAAALALTSGCSADGVPLQSWWGPLESQSGGTPFAAGGSYDVGGLVHAFETTSGRELVEMVLVGGAEGAVGCSVYSSYLREVQAIQAYVDELIANPAERPAPEAWSGYVCSQIEGAALEAFGDRGAYRAMHVLLDVTNGGGPTDGIFRPAPPGADDAAFHGAELLTSPGAYVSRLYERSRHGDDILPLEGDVPGRTTDVDPIHGCSFIAEALLEELDRDRRDYPDRASLALQAGTHRYYHHYTSQESIGLDSGDPLVVGVVLPQWASVEATGGAGELTLFNQIARAPDLFPYEQLLLSSRGNTVPLEVCPGLEGTAGMVWPELGGVPAGDDDDSAGDDDDSAR